MEDKRKLAVSYGTFACVIEGFDDPFKLMRDIISFYHQVSQEEPAFAHFHEIVDMQELQELIEEDMGERIVLEPIAGGVFARRLESPAQVAAGETDAAETDESAVDDVALAGAEESQESGFDDDGAYRFTGLGDADPEDPETGHDDTALGDEVSARAEDPDTEDGDHRAGDTGEAEAEDGAELDPVDAMAGETKDAGNGADDRDASDESDDDADEDRAADTEAGFVWARNDGQERNTGWPDADREPDADGEEPGDALAADAEDGDDAPQEDDEPATVQAFGDGDSATDDPDADDTADDKDDTEDTDDDAPGVAPIRLQGAVPPSDDAGDEDDDEGRTARPASAPIRLQDAIRVAGPEPVRTTGDASDNSSDDVSEPGAPSADRLTLGGALRLGPDTAISREGGDSEDSDGEPPAGAFIDRVADQDETREILAQGQPLQRPAVEDADDDLSIEQIRSNIEEAEATERPAKSGGLRMGGFLRRKPAEETGGEEPEGNQASATEPADPQPEHETRAEKPRSLGGSRLRVIRSGDRQDASDDAPAPSARQAAPSDTPPETAPQTETADAPQAGERQQPQVEPEAPASEPETATPPAAERDKRGNDGKVDPIRSRLQASFASGRAPTSTKESIELDDEEMQDPYSPRGFAQRVGVGSATELLSAAAAFCILVDQKTTVTRTDIMETVQMIMGDKPLSAEAKVKAFGKLVRNGDLNRQEGGEFTLAPETLESFDTRFQAAREKSATGG